MALAFAGASAFAAAVSVSQRHKDVKQAAAGMSLAHGLSKRGRCRAGWQPAAPLARWSASSRPRRTRCGCGVRCRGRSQARCIRESFTRQASREQQRPTCILAKNQHWRSSDLRCLWLVSKQQCTKDVDSACMFWNKWRVALCCLRQRVIARPSSGTANLTACRACGPPYTLPIPAAEVVRPRNTAFQLVQSLSSGTTEPSDIAVHFAAARAKLGEGALCASAWRMGREIRRSNCTVARQRDLRCKPTIVPQGNIFG